MANEQILQQMLPASNGAAITGNDTTDLAHVTRGLIVGVSGNVQVTLRGMTNGTSIVLPNLAAGVVHAFAVKRVWATGTTATTIVGVY